MKKIMATACLVVFSLLINSSAAAQTVNFDKKTRKTVDSSVKFAAVEAVSDGAGVFLKWQTESETKNSGFLVYRVSGDERKLVSTSLIAGGFLQNGQEKTVGGDYSFFDAEGDLNSIYVIESIGADGRKSLTDQITPIYSNDVPEGKAAKSAAADDNQPNSLIESEELIYPKDLGAFSKTAQEVNSLDTHRFVVGQPGVKIGVKKEGLYRVTRAELQAAGFNVSVNSNLWQLYLNGVEQAIIVGGNGDYIEFYGKGIDTPESDTRIYNLIAGTANGKRVGSLFLRAISANVAAVNYNQFYTLKERTTYIYSQILNGEKENFFGRVVGSAGATINFNLSAVSFEAPEARLEVNLQGATSNAHSIKVNINGTDLTAPIVGSGLISLQGTFTIPTQYLRNGVNQLNLTATTGVSLFESLRVDNSRRYVADQNRLLFYTQNYKATKVEGFSSSNIRVFDTSDASNIKIFYGLKTESNGTTFSVNLPANRGRTAMAVENSGLLTADSLVYNEPSTLATRTNAAELVIISHKSLIAQAETWAAYRRAQGTTVKVIDVADVDDEFNYGITGAAAIRGFLQYAVGNWQTAPKYALFVGDASSDPRNYLGNGNFNLVPTKLVDTVYTETGSDEALADFNDDGLAEVAVGRIPARTPAEVTNALAKVTKFEQTIAQAPSRGALFASDLPDGYDFAGLSQRLADQLPGSVAKTYINRSQGDAAALVAAMNQGKFLVNYSGHGNVSVWAAPAFFQTSNIAQLTNSDRLSLFTMLTCLNGYFIQPTGDSLSETLLKTSTGGAAAVWSSTGLTTPDIQETMGTRFYQQVAAGNITRLGDLITDAKTTINSGRDVRLSWVLLGDPMLKMK